MSKTYLKEAVPAAQVAKDLAGVGQTVSGVDRRHPRARRRRGPRVLREVRQLVARSVPADAATQIDEHHRRGCRSR